MAAGLQETPTRESCSVRGGGQVPTPTQARWDLKLAQVRVAALFSRRFRDSGSTSSCSLGTAEYLSRIARGWGWAVLPLAGRL